MMKKLKTILLNTIAAAVALFFATAFVSFLKYMGALYLVNTALLGVTLFSIFLFLMWGEDA